MTLVYVHDAFLSYSLQSFTLQIQVRIHRVLFSVRRFYKENDKCFTLVDVAREMHAEEVACFRLVGGLYIGVIEIQLGW